MTRYTTEHKARSTAALKSAAARLFRTQGFTATSIDELCQAAGLTRGTFYAHFPSKQALYEAVLVGPHDFVERLRGRTQRAVQAGAGAVARDYLKPAHRDAVRGGCSLAGLAAETAGSTPAAQEAYATAVEELVAEFRRGQTDLSQDRALAAVALCIGGLLMSSACGEAPVADRLERSASRWVTRLLDGG